MVPGLLSLQYRMGIDSSFDECGGCSTVCCHDALSETDIRRRRPGEARTLCGDCLGTCQERNIGCRALGLRPPVARSLFLVVVVSLRAAYLGAARI